MSKVVSKMKSFLGFDEFEDEDEVMEEEEIMEEEEAFAPVLSSKKNGKVVNIHTANTAKLMITKPLVYDDATEICTALKNRKIVVINTTSLELRTAQRLIDFVGGACYALCGELQEVEKGVFIVSPSNVEVSNELKSELSNKGMFNWASK
ncbi:cell division protein SepF [Clostridium sp. LIBA-8841]|uniref:cell division protein SepF n=1 Tax=Clostridium sp. LIBA-8841 TaxID=2987530 RepID=UPI002AC4FBD6|nr:cell division protein SepF [Clostridium sp. LIBA-8841]MDZ5252797.1 cell division protein SepF [Clostridium sp. LIBA-8841]